MSPPLSLTLFWNSEHIQEHNQKQKAVLELKIGSHINAKNIKGFQKSLNADDVRYHVPPSLVGAFFTVLANHLSSASSSQSHIWGEHLWWWW
jgi:hypothetical protein